MADNRSRIESVRRELRAIARFDAQKIHESSSATTLYNQQSSRPGTCFIHMSIRAAGAHAQQCSKSRTSRHPAKAASWQARAGDDAPGGIEFFDCSF